MQLRVDALEGHLAKSLAPLYVIASDEHLLALEAADKIRKAARANGYSERDVLTVERTFKWGELLAANQALSLFGDKKLIELRIPTGKPGKDGGAALQAYAKDLSPDNLTLITLPKLDWQTAKAAWVGSLQQAAVYIEIPAIERAQLPGWIGTRLAAQGLSFFKFAAGKAIGNGSDGDGVITKGFKSGLGDDSAVHPAGIGDGHPTIGSDEFDEAVAFGDEFRISPGVGRHIRRGSARFFTSRWIRPT